MYDLRTHLPYTAQDADAVYWLQKSANDNGACRWWALCENPATGTMTHPILGNVPICNRCRTKVETIEARNGL